MKIGEIKKIKSTKLNFMKISKEEQKIKNDLTIINKVNISTSQNNFNSYINRDIDVKINKKALFISFLGIFCLIAFLIAFKIFSKNNKFLGLPIKHRLLFGSNKYGSFSSVKESNYCQMFIDGKDYFEDFYQKLMNAKESIYISDWWLSPELFLVRPVNEKVYLDMAEKKILTKDFGEQVTRLMDILDYKEKEGVKIYIIVFFEWPLTLSINSKHTLKTIKSINKNINIIRYPVEQDTLLWSNHEKIVIIDRLIGYVGGYDLCWGRYDTNRHPIFEEVNEENLYEYPLIDYSNERIAAFDKVDNYIKENVPRISTNRLPWHDAQVRIIGPAVQDLTKHFLERWNHAIYGILKEKGINYNKNDEEPKNGYSLLDKFFDYLSNNNNKNDKEKEEQLKSEYQLLNIDEKINKKLEEEIYEKYIESGSIMSDIQTLRSTSEWSTGIKKTETSILKAYYDLIENSKYYIYIENQFFISKSYTDEEKRNCPYSKKVKDVKNEIAFYLRKRIERAYKNDENFKVYIVLSSLPDYPGEIESNFILQTILQYTYNTISRNYGLSLIEQLEKVMGDNWKKYIGFYSLRNHGIMNNIPKTEIIYVHSKLMIVDDTKVIIGSANINDRSMIGERDSEIGVLIEEEKQNYQIMNGENDYKSAKLASMLRKRLWAEHLGIDSNDPILEDPLSQELFTFINSRAKKNSDIYHELFRCYPNDEYNTYNSIKNAKKLREGESPDELLNKYKKMKDQIVGHIIEFPLQFLKDENLGKKNFGFDTMLPSYTFS